MNKVLSVIFLVIALIMTLLAMAYLIACIQSDDISLFQVLFNFVAMLLKPLLFYIFAQYLRHDNFTVSKWVYWLLIITLTGHLFAPVLHQLIENNGTITGKLFSFNTNRVMTFWVPVFAGFWILSTHKKHRDYHAAELR